MLFEEKNKLGTVWVQVGYSLGTTGYNRSEILYKQILTGIISLLILIKVLVDTNEVLTGYLQIDYDGHAI